MSCLKLCRVAVDLPRQPPLPRLCIHEVHDTGKEKSIHQVPGHQLLRTLPLRPQARGQGSPRVAQAFEAKELYGYKVEEIAPMLKVSEPRVYQLIARAKAIGKKYRRNNG